MFYLCSSMLDDRLSRLSIISIMKYMLSNFDYIRVMNDFAIKKYNYSEVINYMYVMKILYCCNFSRFFIYCYWGTIFFSLDVSNISDPAYLSCTKKIS